MKLSFTFWKRLSNFWTVFFLALIVLDFFLKNQLKEILEAVSFIYIGILAIYVTKKEFERWYNRHTRRHMGEYFVIAWTVVVIGVFLGRILFIHDYELPASVISAYVAVITILAITRRSRSIYKKKKKK